MVGVFAEELAADLEADATVGWEISISIDVKPSDCGDERTSSHHDNLLCRGTHGREECGVKSGIRRIGASEEMNGKLCFEKEEIQGALCTFKLYASPWMEALVLKLSKTEILKRRSMNKIVFRPSVLIWVQDSS